MLLIANFFINCSHYNNFNKHISWHNAFLFHQADLKLQIITSVIIATPQAGSWSSWRPPQQASGDIKGGEKRQKKLEWELSLELGLEQEVHLVPDQLYQLIWFVPG